MSEGSAFRSCKHRHLTQLALISGLVTMTQKGGRSVILLHGSSSIEFDLAAQCIFTPKSCKQTPSRYISHMYCLLWEICIHLAAHAPLSCRLCMPCSTDEESLFLTKKWLRVHKHSISISMCISKYMAKHNTIQIKKLSKLVNVSLCD